MITILTPDRVLHEIEDSANARKVLELMHYTLANDGVWVPACDIRQYEAGKRPARHDLRKGCK